MPYQLCAKVRELEPYRPIQGDYRIRLDANESFYQMPAELLDEIHKIADTLDFNRYPDPMASELIESFCGFYGLDPDTVTATNGSDEMLYLLASAMLQRGSTVVTAEPDFSMYGFYSFLSENKVIGYKKNELMNINADELIKTVNDSGADMVIFSNPCNPTGLGISADDARKLVKSVKALVVLDEAYMDFWDQSILNEAADYDNLIVLKTASKAVGCAALRIGFAVANKTITNALRAVKSPYNVNALTQKIGACVYRHGGLLKERRDTMIRNTRELYKGVMKLREAYGLKMDIAEPCANFVFVRTEPAEDIFRYLLDNGIAVRYFPSCGALRITTGSEQENAELLRYIEKYIMEKYLSENR